MNRRVGSPPRLALLPDHREEHWPSMDLCADMLHQHLGLIPDIIRSDLLHPTFRRCLGRLPGIGNHRHLHNADRFLNRFLFYPRFLRRERTRHDLFHIIDHSHAHLALGLPPGRVGVFCHDLDTFQCLLSPRDHPRPAWFRAMTHHILRGLQRASVIFHSTSEVGRQLRDSGWIDPPRLVQAPYGIATEFTPLPSAHTAPSHEPPCVLHVGSTIPRKRIDVLLEVFAGLHATRPDLQLIQVGGTWTAKQWHQLTSLGIAGSVRQFRGLDRSQLAGHYRRAAVVLQPSESEGFGLPVVEALACGAIVAASDIPVLREVGGPAVAYAPVGDVPAWVAVAGSLLDQPERAPDLPIRLQWASRFSWEVQARTIADAYRKLWEEIPSVSSS